MGRQSDARERLLNAARSAFWTRGCLSVSVDGLCQEAGINKGSFYHFFPSKQALVIETLNGFWTELRQEVIEPAFDPQYAPLERLRQFFLRHYRRQQTAQETHGSVPGCPFLNVGTEMSAHDPKLRGHVESILSRNAAYLESTLNEAAAKGDYAGDAAADARAVLATLVGLLLQAKILNRPDVILDGAEYALRALASGGRTALGTTPARSPAAV